jgi:release factor glutamine methyltransferase
LRVGVALSRVAADLAESGIETPDVDAALMLGHVLGLSRSAVYAQANRDVTPDEETRLAELVRRRCGREPLAYVLGEWGFRRLTLRTDARALVPRPETEVVVERCLALLRDVPEPRVLDVGTGSGAIALAIADEHPGARVVAIDASPDALSLARENLDRNGLADRVDLIARDLEDGLPEGPYDLVVANPPYVLEPELSELAPEVRDWEPRAALVDTGQSELVERAALAVLKPGGALVLETHWNGARGTADRLGDLGYDAVTITRDLAGRERVVEGRHR